MYQTYRTDTNGKRVSRAIEEIVEIANKDGDEIISIVYSNYEDELTVVYKSK